eukprot:4388818-Prymnesium_polylepis.1
MLSRSLVRHPSTCHTGPWASHQVGAILMRCVCMATTRVCNESPEMQSQSPVRAHRRQLRRLAEPNSQHTAVKFWVCRPNAWCRLVHVHVGAPHPRPAHAL